MAKVVGLLNGANNQNTDFHFSTPVSTILTQGVIEGLGLTQPGGAGTDITVNMGKALIEVIRTSIIPNEVFLCVFNNTAVETITCGNSKKIYIEISSTHINNPALNTETAGTGIGDIVIADDYPSANYLPLGETNSSGLLSTTTRQEAKLKGAKLDSNIEITNTKGNNWKLFYTNGSGETQELSFGTAGQVLGFTGTTSAPVPISPTVDIAGLTETTTINLTDEFLVNQIGNKRIKASNVLQSTKSSFVAGENITAGMPVCQLTSGTSNQVITLPGVFINEGTADIVTFTIENGYTSHTFSSITANVGGKGNTYWSGHIIVTDSSNNILYTSNTQNGASTTSKTFTFSGINLVPGTYKIRFVDNGGHLILFNYSVTTTLTLIRTKDSSGKVYQTTASNSDKINFIGFAYNTVSSGGNAYIDISGINGSQSSLTIGTTYYLSNTSGGLSTSAGTNSVKVGKAVSSTSILIVQPSL